MNTIEGPPPHFHELLHAALTFAPTAVLITDAEGRIVFSSMAAEALLRRPRADLLGRSLDEVLKSLSMLNGPPLVPEALPVAPSLRSGEPVIGMECSLVRSDGTRVKLVIDAAPARDTSGALLGSMVCLREFETREGRDADRVSFEASFRTFMEAAPDPIVIHRGGRLVYANPATLSLFGYQHLEQIVGRRVMDFVHPDDVEAVRERIRIAVEENRPVPAREERFIRRDGRVLTMVVAALPFFFEGKPSILVVAQDVTAQRAAAAERERLLAEVDAQRELFRAIFENAPAGIALLNGSPDFVIELANPAFRSLAPTLPMEGRSMRKVARELFPYLDRVMRTGVPEHVFGLPLRIRRSPDGPLEQGYFTFSIVPVRTLQSHDKALLGIVVENTAEVLAQQRAREMGEAAARRAAELRTILETIADGVFVFDPAGKLVLANAAALRMLGVARLEAAQYVFDERPALSRVRRLDGTPLLADEMPIARALLGEEVRNFDAIFLDPSGQRELVVRINASPIRNGKGAITGVVGVARDITEITKFEQLKDEFVRAAAHELKTPVAVMKGYAQMLLRSADEIEEQHREMLLSIDRGATRMDRTVQDLLDVSQLHLGRLQLLREPLELSALVAGAVTHAAGSSPRHRVRLVRSEPATILGDRERLARVICALIDNAIRYSPGGGDVDVELSTQKGEAVISVTDRGVGIPRDKQPLIFQRFYRAHAGTTQDYGGMGVELYLSSEVVRALGGRIWFESEEGRGTTFYVALPLRHDESA